MQKKNARWAQSVRRIAAVSLLAGTLAACASSQDELSGFEDTSDPFELYNRTIFGANQAADFLVIRPVTVTYNQVVPQFMRDSVTNVLRNMRTPAIVINELLQGDFQGAGNAAERFFINTTLGLGGLFDIANYNNQGNPFEAEDFGQTLATWGVGEGPYLVLPLLGPSNMRDAIGIGIDSLIDPIGYAADGNFAFAAGRIAATVIDIRSRTIDELDEIEASSVDYYASIRSLYGQIRRADIADGDLEDSAIDIPDIDINEISLEGLPAAEAPSAAPVQPVEADAVSALPSEAGADSPGEMPLWQ